MDRNNSGMTQHEVEQLKYENLQLKEHIQHQDNKIGELREELQNSRRIIDELWTMNKNLERENSEHVLEIDELNHKLCNKNCVACTILWICETGLGKNLCIRQLEKIITAYAGEKIEKDDLKCDQLMEILKKCELVSFVKGFEYPSEEDDKIRVIGEAWNTLMKLPDSLRVIILGRVISVDNDVGHVEICNLDTRTLDRTEVTIHNPQKGNGWHVNQDFFREHVFNDESLILYQVNLEKLKQIMDEHEHILHCTSRSGPSLALSEVAVSAVPE